MALRDENARAESCRAGKLSTSGKQPQGPRGQARTQGSASRSRVWTAQASGFS